MLQPFHIICVQDPPCDLPWRPNPGPYKVWYRAKKELGDEDDPRNRSSNSAHLLTQRVAFYVHQSISVHDWDVDPYDDQNANLVATLWLKTPSGKIAIHNVYNRQKSLDIGRLMDTCTGLGSDILVGDFNLHHPTWAGDEKRYVTPIINWRR